MVCLTLKEGYQRIKARDQLYKEPGVTAKWEAEYGLSTSFKKTLYLVRTEIKRLEYYQLIWRGQVLGDPRRKYNEHDRNDLEIKKVQSNCAVAQPRWVHRLIDCFLLFKDANIRIQYGDFSNIQPNIFKYINTYNPTTNN